MYLGLTAVRDLLGDEVFERVQRSQALFRRPRP